MISRKFFSPAQAVGIYIDHRGLTAVQCAPDRPGRPQWHEQQPLEDLSHAESLADFFTRIRRRVGQGYIPINIALADPWVHQVVMGFDSLPRKTQERASLVHWRLARDWQRDADRHAISWQHLGESGGQQWIVVQSVEQQRLAPLLQQARAQGLMLSGIDVIGNLLLNLLPSPRSSLLLHLQPDYWSLTVTREHGWPVYRRSAWQSWPDASQYESFAAQLERMLVSVKPERVERLVLATGAEPEPALCQALASRLGLAPEVLTVPGVQLANRPPEELLAMQAVRIPCH